jgi:hypothetical protein
VELARSPIFRSSHFLGWVTERDGIRGLQL